jgi:hypothetical protein
MTEEEKEQSKVHYPSYYRYIRNHKSITLNLNLIDYNKIMSYFHNSANIKQHLLNVVDGKETDINNMIKEENEKLKKENEELKKINRILSQD